MPISPPLVDQYDPLICVVPMPHDATVHIRLDEECTILPTLPFDVVVDCFFLLDILVTLNTGLLINGEYIDDRWAVTKAYLKGMFFFDVTTSFPVSFVELAAADLCRTASHQELNNSEGSQVLDPNPYALNPKPLMRTLQTRNKQPGALISPPP